MPHSHPVITDHRGIVQRVLLITLGLNIVTVGLKVTVGWLTGSLSLMADALHSVTDGANNVLGLATNRLANPHPDRDHPYGHQKYEAIGALGVAAFLGIACFEILQSAVERILTGTSDVTIGPTALWIMLIVLGINVFVAFYERRMGLALGNKFLLADARHTMSDIWTTIVVLGGLIGIWQGLQWLDIVLAFPVALLVFKSGWEVLRENLPWLVDEMAIAPEAIHQQVMQVPGVINCHSIASRGLLGRQVFIDMHLVVKPTTVEAAHRITEAVEDHLEDLYGPARITIHIEPREYTEDDITY